jgi:uncharacterized protein (DUF486 family)
MIMAWYGHLKYLTKAPIYIAILASWLVPPARPITFSLWDK